MGDSEMAVGECRVSAVWGAFTMQLPEVAVSLVVTSLRPTVLMEQRFSNVRVFMKSYVLYFS